MHLNRDDFPWLGQLRSGMFPDCETHVLDPDAMPESVISRWPDGALDPFRAEAARALRILENLDIEEGARWLAMQIALPAGNSAYEWVRYLTEHLEEFYPRRTPSTIGGDGILLSKITTFTDKAAANAAATAVNRAHGATLRAWADDPTSPWRLHLYADLGAEVGYQLLRAEVEAHQADPKAAPPPVEHPVTGCVVLFRKHPETREPFIAVTYPEVSRPLDARQRYPDLPLLFGAYFGQDYADLDHDRWAAERSFNFSTPPAVKDRIADQLADLLTQDDDTLRRDVEALGSYVLPDALRRWVTGLHRRMTRIDWSRP